MIEIYLDNAKGNIRRLIIIIRGFYIPKNYDNMENLLPTINKQNYKEKLEELMNNLNKDELTEKIIIIKTKKYNIYKKIPNEVTYSNNYDEIITESLSYRYNNYIKNSNLLKQIKERINYEKLIDSLIKINTRIINNILSYDLTQNSFKCLLLLNIENNKLNQYKKLID